jgi:branched-subunit amino acid transport protein
MTTASFTTLFMSIVLKSLGRRGPEANLMAGIMTTLFVPGAALCMHSNIALRHHGLPYESMFVAGIAFFVTGITYINRFSFNVMKHHAAAKA